jgi:hypothetical protein
MRLRAVQVFHGFSQQDKRKSVQICANPWRKENVQTFVGRSEILFDKTEFLFYYEVSTDPM